MNGKLMFFMSFFVSILFFSQVAFSQNIVLATPGGPSDVYETTSVFSFVANLDPVIEKTAALRYFLAQEIVGNDASILNITRTSGGNGTAAVFAIVTETGLSATIVEDKVNASIIASNTLLLDIMAQNNFTPNELSNYIKSTLLNN